MNILFSILIFILLISISFNRCCGFSQYSKENDIFYIENFFDQDDFQYIIDETEKINILKNEKFRKVGIVEDNKITQILYSPKILQKINSIVKKTLFKSDFPIEYRIYPENSPGMKCHSDLLMYVKPQYEAVLTLKNDSDSYTEWYDYNNKRHVIYTKPNSLILVKAKGNVHCVSSISKGSRSILKYIYTQTDKVNNNYRKEMKRFNLF